MYIKEFVRSVVQRPRRYFKYSFVAFSVVWTLLEALNFFVPTTPLKGGWTLTGAIILSLVYGVFATFKPRKIKITVANSNTFIHVLFGDLFQQKGLRAIAVSEYFDSQLGKPVSDQSLHGIFIKRCFGGYPEVLDAQLDEQLSGITFKETARPEGKTRRYPIGTTALIQANDDKYITFAFTEVDPTTSKADANVTMMWVSLHHLWQRARIECGGVPLNLPLVGSGLSGVGLPTRDLLNLIILSAITEIKTTHITSPIQIVLMNDRFDEVDLREIKQYWES